MFWLLDLSMKAKPLLSEDACSAFLYPDFCVGSNWEEIVASYLKKVGALLNTGQFTMQFPHGVGVSSGLEYRKPGFKSSFSCKDNWMALGRLHVLPPSQTGMAFLP